MNHPESSETNAEKLNRLEAKIDRVTGLIEGAGSDAPGLMARLSMVERVLFGKEKQDEGLVYKVGVLWRVHVWVLCTLSAAGGFVLREVIRLIWHV